jgi:hypothetical protein
VIGHTELVRMIADREQVDRQLQEIAIGWRLRPSWRFT